jgi:hypothetical protein
MRGAGYILHITWLSVSPAKSLCFCSSVLCYCWTAWPTAHCKNVDPRLCPVACLPVCLSACPTSYVLPYSFPPPHLPICPPPHLSICPPLHLPPCLPICLHLPPPSAPAPPTSAPVPPAHLSTSPPSHPPTGKTHPYSTSCTHSPT